VTVPHGVAPVGSDPFTGYAPWAVEASTSWQQLTGELSRACDFRYDEAACTAYDELMTWKQQNEDLYCFTHRADCDASLSRRLHTLLGLAGMIPVFGIAFDGADALIFAAEGDHLGAAMAIGFAIPGLGDAARAGKYALGALHVAPDVGGGIRYVDEAIGAACSFTAETTVVTPDGDVAIGELEVGDEVLARDEITGETSVRRIIAVLVHADTVTGSVVIDGETIETTPEHPFFSLDRGFVAASELRPGELVARDSGMPGEVDSVTWDGGPAVMWNLTVAVDHTFFVGDGGWWVHNACGWGPTYGDLRRHGERDAHHIIQDAAVRDLPGYSYTRAPAIALPGPSTRAGTAHYLATQVQKSAIGGGTYAVERRIAYRALRASGLDAASARAAVERADQYFGTLGITGSTVTRIPLTRTGLVR
jgi:hypothetical protein